MHTNELVCVFNSMHLFNALDNVFHSIGSKNVWLL